MSAKRVLIDTDPGLDDALALALALRSQRLDVRAITVVSGNVALADCAANALRVLEALEAEPVPEVFAGRAEPLSPPVARAQHVHGTDGLGGVAEAYPVRRLRLSERPAPDAIVELARRHGRQLTLIALGPLTNVAAAIELDPAVMAGIGEIVVMGGSADGRGNMTPHAEFNFYFDPLAARNVLRAGLPVTLVGLNVTERALLSRERFERRLAAMPSTPLRGFLARVASPFFDFCKKTRGVEACAMHDPLAVAVAIDPGLVRTESVVCDVVAEPGLTRGMTIVDRTGRHGAATPIRVATEVDAAGFLDLWLDTVCAA